MTNVLGKLIASMMCHFKVETPICNNNQPTRVTASRLYVKLQFIFMCVQDTEEISVVFLFLA